MINPKTNRLKTFYLCTNCRQLFGREDMILEHIVPIETQNPETLEEYYSLMFDESNVTPYCKTCAAAKTKKERKKP